jgi:hypothetical protein
MPLLRKGLRMAVGKMPKMIDPTTHAVLDYAVAGAFLIMGIRFWKRSKRAAIGSLLCGGAAAANIALTDYPGGARKLLSYKAHGHVDAGLAGVTAAVPHLLRLGDVPEARFFEVAALAETAIVGLTDFDYYEHSSPRRWLLRKKTEGAPEDTAAQGR